VATAPTVDAVVRAAGPHVGPLMSRIEERLAAVTAGHGELLAEHAGSTIAAGGKRLRPLLVLVAAGPEATGDGMVRAAVAVELVHSATLVHDDVLDAADLRRGRPTVVAAAGRDIATATGDLLFSRAFAELANNGRIDEVRVLSAAGSALASGELLQRADAWDASVPVERYLERCELKTARLFQAACELGALESGAEDGRVGVLGAFGRRVGLAFQLLDDVLDVSGPADRTGKHRGADLLDGTVTLPLILARERDPELAALDVRAVRSPADAEAVCAQIEATGALEEAKRRALTIVADAKAELPDLPGPQQGVLELVADGVVERYS
jgi:geranylgeranyl pyrophosphate synthase